ncbi:MAG: cell wall metabolism sensor histidine kinase WalK [Firmicutes bacterium]|nr:cell wall metabolism sensor histidine kinase WalK [Bacillota bacterium]
MFRSLYAKLMCVFLAVMLLSFGLLTVLLNRRIRDDKIQARLDTLVAQAYELSDLFYLAARVDDPLMANYLSEKVKQILIDYEAYAFMVDRDCREFPLRDNMVELTYEYTEEEMHALLVSVMQGMEIRQRSVMSNTGNPMFTVGVPYTENERVMGAVFVFTSEQSVEASFQDILSGVSSAMLVALALASILILAVCQWITRPLRAMAQAAERFAHGDFRQRVWTGSRDEVGLLAKSFNSMAADLGRLEETRREFVANVSHELRSPLTSMQGFINGILDGTVPEMEREKYLGIVLDETKRLGKLIATLLDLSHIENGQTPLVRSSFNINEMIARVLIRQEARINGQNMRVRVEFAEEVAMVNADADRIEQVMINLIDNAVKYTGEGGVITLSTAREKDAVRVAVKDSGPGVSEEDLPRIFDRFYMADKARTNGGGTGLGLAIVKSILEQHGAKIYVFSKPGEGTRFEFTLEGA